MLYDNLMFLSQPPHAATVAPRLPRLLFLSVLLAALAQSATGMQDTSRYSSGPALRSENVDGGNYGGAVLEVQPKRATSALKNVHKFARKAAERYSNLLDLKPRDQEQIVPHKSWWSSIWLGTKKAEGAVSSWLSRK